MAITMFLFPEKCRSEKVEKIRQQINLAAYLYADHSLVKRLPEADEQDYKRLYKALEKVPERSAIVCGIYIWFNRCAKGHHQKSSSDDTHFPCNLSTYQFIIKISNFCLDN